MSSVGASGSSSTGGVFDREPLLEVRRDEHDPLVARTVLRTTPRRFGRETEGAETSHLAVVVVGPTLVVGAVLAHGHGISLSAVSVDAERGHFSWSQAV